MSCRVKFGCGMWTAIAFAIAGCGSSERSSVSGRVVRHDGAPLVGARVTAKSSDGKFARGVTDDAGRFQLGIAQYGDGVPPGQYQVTILEDRGDIDRRTPRTIPEKYEDPAKSGLNILVKPNERAELNVTLEPK